MSEGTHSPAAEATEVMSAPTVKPQPRFSAEQKRKWAYIVGGTALVAAVGVGLFQVFRPEPGAAANTAADGDTGSRYARGDLSRPVSTVNGHPISWRELAEECVSRHGREILENMINRSIIQQACARQNVSVTEPEVEAEIRRIAKKFGMTPANWFQMLQAERNITPAQYTRDIIWPMLALKKIAGVNVTVTDAEARKLFLREYGPRVEARMILVDNQRRAGEVHEKLMRNPTKEEFSQLAQRYSIEPTSRALGGDIPPIRRYSGNKQLEDMAFGLRKGQISAAMQVAQSRWVILMSEGKTVPKVTFDQVRNEVDKQLREEKTQQAVAQIFDKLRRQTRVDNFLTNTSTRGVRQTSGTTDNNAGRARVGGGTYPPSSTGRRTEQPRIR